jgi:hypothetical protein
MHAWAQVLVAGPDDLSHPLNRKARCAVFLRDLQREAGLTDAALQHIALICGPRCLTGSLQGTRVCCRTIARLQRTLKGPPRRCAAAHRPHLLAQVPLHFVVSSCHLSARAGLAGWGAEG